MTKQTTLIAAVNIALWRVDSDGRETRIDLVPGDQVPDDLTPVERADLERLGAIIETATGATAPTPDTHADEKATGSVVPDSGVASATPEHGVTADEVAALSEDKKATPSGGTPKSAK